MWFVNAHVLDVLTGDVMRHRAVETAADGTVAQVAAGPPPGLGENAGCTLQFGCEIG